MRLVTHDDLTAAARSLLPSPQAAWPAVLRRLFTLAHAADCYRKRTGRLHPLWGNGSVRGVLAAGGRLPEMPRAGPLYWEALAAAIHAALEWKHHQNIKNAARALPFPTPTQYVRLPVERHRRLKMGERKVQVAQVDPVWTHVCEEARAAVRDEPLLGGFFHSGILHHPTLERALAYRFSLKLASGEMSEQLLREIADEAYASDSELGQAARADCVAVYDRDPACHRFLQPILFFKGYQAVQAYRIGHWLWVKGRRDLAYFVQMRVSEVFGVDIHPNAKVGRGIMIDHAHSIVIGETAVVGDNVSMLHSVTLGGTGKEDGDRHPKIGNGVLIGAGAKILGNIHIGSCTRVAAGSVVLQDVPPCKTVAGIPARIVGEAGCEQPSLNMDQRFSDGVDHF